MPISPGDLITASISLIDSKADEWSITICNITTRQGFQQTFTYNSSRLSADWIIKSPTVEDQVSHLANFRTVTFKNAHVKLGNNDGTIGSFSYSQVIITNTISLKLASVSPISPDG